MVSRWETGERKPDYTYQERLCTLFQKDAGELGFLKVLACPRVPVIGSMVAAGVAREVALWRRAGLLMESKG